MFFYLMILSNIEHRNINKSKIYYILLYMKYKITIFILFNIIEDYIKKQYSIEKWN